VLVRDYQGQRHTVTVVSDGFDWQGETYPSLSAIARAITGNAWSGPRFFALARGNSAPARRNKNASAREGREQFLKDALAHGPKRVSDVEEAAAKAHVEPHALEQARADLGVVTSRANTGSTLSVQWSLPG
jgi:Protein of unknown function (DUF2924)